MKKSTEEEKKKKKKRESEFETMIFQIMEKSMKKALAIVIFYPPDVPSVAVFGQGEAITPVPIFKLIHA